MKQDQPATTAETPPGGTETIVLRHLADAMDALQSAAAETGNGFVADYCANAQREIQKAMKCAIGGDDAFS